MTNRIGSTLENLIDIEYQRLFAEESRKNTPIGKIKTSINELVSAIKHKVWFITMVFPRIKLWELQSWRDKMHIRMDEDIVRSRKAIAKHHQEFAGFLRIRGFYRASQYFREKADLSEKIAERYQRGMS